MGRICKSTQWQLDYPKICTYPLHASHVVKSKIKGIKVHLISSAPGSFQGRVHLRVQEIHGHPTLFPRKQTESMHRQQTPVAYQCHATPRRCLSGPAPLHPRPLLPTYPIKLPSWSALKTTPAACSSITGCTNMAWLVSWTTPTMVTDHTRN